MRQLISASITTCMLTLSAARVLAAPEGYVDCPDAPGYSYKQEYINTASHNTPPFTAHVLPIQKEDINKIDFDKTLLNLHRVVSTGSSPNSLPPRFSCTTSSTWCKNLVTGSVFTSKDPGLYEAVLVPTKTGEIVPVIMRNISIGTANVPVRKRFATCRDGKEKVYSLYVSYPYRRDYSGPTKNTYWLFINTKSIEPIKNKSAPEF